MLEADIPSHSNTKNSVFDFFLLSLLTCTYCFVATPSDNPTRTFMLIYVASLAFSTETHTQFYLALLPPWGSKAAEVLMEDLQAHLLPASDGICSTVIVCKEKQMACEASVCYGALPRRNACQALQKLSDFGTFLFDKRQPAKFKFHPSLLQIILPAEVPFLLGNTLQIGAAFWQSREAQSASRFCQGNGFKSFTLHLTLLVKGSLQQKGKFLT